MRALCLPLLLVLTFGASSALAADFDHSAFDALLKKHVKDGKVDYAGVKADRAKLDAYLATLAKADLSGLSKNDAYAFWINAYNALTWKGVLDTLPPNQADWGKYKVTEVKPSFWKGVKYAAAGKQLTLDQIEHEILRPTYKDARVHFAVNCASVGCPTLRSEAYTGAKLDAQLNEQVRQFMTNKSKLIIDRGSKRIQINKIFEWFKGDFVGEAGSIPKYLSRYAEGDLKRELANDAWTISYLEYDWHLNR